MGYISGTHVKLGFDIFINILQEGTKIILMKAKLGSVAKTDKDRNNTKGKKDEKQWQKIKGGWNMQTDVFKNE